MKRILLLVLTVLVFNQIIYAKIWRVNNMPGVTADFTTAQAANDAANAGDTIHLEPSVSDYGNVNCSKRLVWISTGNFLSDNPGNQFSSTPGTVGQMSFLVGSEGSVVSVVSNGNFYCYASSISIIRSYFLGGGIQTSAASNIILSQNYLIGGFSVMGNNQIITNNIMVYVDFAAASSGVVTNNVFTLNSGGVNIYNSVFQNNICKGGFYNFFNSNVSYNMHSGTGIPAGNNNLLNVAMASVFEDNTGTVDKNFRLKTGSPAIGSGFGGADMGAFGGSAPYVLALQPAIPAITSMSVPSSTGNNTIQVTFSAKSNN